MPAFTISIPYSTGSPSQSNYVRKRNKKHLNQKGKGKLVLFAITWSYISAKSLQLCPTLSDPTDRGPPGTTIPGILQARTLEWVAISFSNAWKWKVKVKSLSCVWLLATPWTAAHQAPPPMGFSKQEYWSGVPLPSCYSCCCCCC